jgi:hypothetical protein
MICISRAIEEEWTWDQIDQGHGPVGVAEGSLVVLMDPVRVIITIINHLRPLFQYPLVVVDLEGHPQ